MKRDKEELKKFKNPRDLTSKEYENLTLELKCCFFLKPWNISAEINTVEDWVNLFYVDYLPEDDSEWVKNISDRWIMHSKNLSRSEVNSLIAFVKRMTMEEFCKMLIKKHKEK